MKPIISLERQDCNLGIIKQTNTSHLRLDGKQPCGRFLHNLATG